MSYAEAWQTYVVRIPSSVPNLEFGYSILVLSRERFLPRFLDLQLECWGHANTEKTLQHNPTSQSRSVRHHLRKTQRGSVRHYTNNGPGWQ